jgi:FkbM family methyltransferase
MIFAEVSTLYESYKETYAGTLAQVGLAEYIARVPQQIPPADGKAYAYERLHTRLAPPERYAVVRLDKGFRMQLDLADPEQLKVYFYGHYHERYEAELVQRLLTGDKMFWDIGANVGYFTLVAATALDNRGQIVAFEPGQNAYARLVENISLNPYQNITTFQMAVTDREGEAVLRVFGDIADSSATLYQSDQTAVRDEVCRTVALDQVLKTEGLRLPDLVKVDAEGAELAVLQGVKELIFQAPPPVPDGNGRKELAGGGGQ